MSCLKMKNRSLGKMQRFIYLGHGGGVHVSTKHKPGSELECNRIKHLENLEGRIMLLRRAGNTKSTIEMDPYRWYLNNVRLWNRWRSRHYPWNCLDQERWRDWRRLVVLRGVRVLFDSNTVAITHQPWFNELIS